MDILVLLQRSIHFFKKKARDCNPGGGNIMTIICCSYAVHKPIMSSMLKSETLIPLTISCAFVIEMGRLLSASGNLEVSNMET